eukprot:CAMPEP_0172326870 /NCGR_PEP_ID=MMETSP1058-20130122/57864_1 /TAXON_ID=83371 /ORGANISM="Detonula confervacea, Strain CCMP 353" /LENGTH=331 /DNA_ID=CAMNT_0013043765 /DNA_START=102 /DNA_END=1097 /DNA_ORIENTATION=-
MVSATAHKRFLSTIVAILAALIHAEIEACTEDCAPDASETPLGLGRYPTWEDAPASTEEFDHDNDKSVCRLPIISVEEWEAERYWEREDPVIVQNVTDGWPALEHWTKEEFLRRYPDVMVGMGRSKDLGQTGPDDAGDRLTKTTIKDFVVNHMHDLNTEKYVFDRKLNMPDGLLDDCQPYPMPTRMFSDYGEALIGMGAPERTMWKDHLALTIGRDLQGLTFHRHNAAMNTVVFGSKRWILYDAERIASSKTRLKRMTRDVDNPIQLTTSEWIRKLYHMDERMDEIRNYGHDCVQRAGEMIYVPRGWAHMVINIGDTVAIVSERGLDAMEP